MSCLIRPSRRFPVRGPGTRFGGEGKPLQSPILVLLS
jgi:hypothetical protein